MVAGMLGLGAMTAQAGTTPSMEKYVVKLDAKKPYSAFVAGEISYSVCKILE